MPSAAGATAIKDLWPGSLHWNGALTFTQMAPHGHMRVQFPSRPPLLVTEQRLLLGVMYYSGEESL